ncbi:hypothetical protein [Streptomyces sp. NBC_00557]|uniref:hypothetical protein n=1 Tax=Streptomyces sp. NBC_00557 TaxID=2975776 RepID=UPI002E80D452|nr:hypothetical protein [Streptomyces sp. NBC_00557]WUC38618.1 hypothetical protein OG956_32465 [Streptomyces sp. NBC_00557]
MTETTRAVALDARGQLVPGWSSLRGRVLARVAVGSPAGAHFVGQVLVDAPKDVVPALQALRDEQVESRAVVDTVVALHR